MTDSDEETFLLEALEQLEEKETKLSQVHPNSLADTNNGNKISQNINSESKAHISPAKHTSFDKEANFRANLLKSLKNCQTNKIQNCFGNETLKRKLESNELDSGGGLENENILPSKKNIDEFHWKEPRSTSDSNFISFHQSTNIKRRKFPGPAGLLPEMNELPVKPSLISLETSEFNKEANNQTICSQTTAQDFASGPWKEMYLDLSLLTDVSHFFKNHNIKSFSRKNPLRSQASIRKVNCIAVMVRSLDLSHRDATAIFCDQTGEIRGTISTDVIEKYGELICAGTVFVLKDATILSPPVFQSGVGVLAQLKKHYLTLTLNSIVTIYSPNDDNGSVNKTKVLILKNAEFEALLSSRDDEDKERKELIENVENEPRISIFENIGSEKNKNSPSVIKYSGNTNFKSPYANTNKVIRNTISQNATARLTPKNLNTTTTNKSFTASSNNSTFNLINNSFNMPSKNSNSFNVKFKNLNSSSSGSNTSNAKDKGLPNENNRSFISTKNTLVDTIDDDDELDTLLASIDTDTL
ncbi:UNVERIFIED_CONTAM: hypothetical protein RMT77_002787 [Armadillidium vulgare]